MLTAFAVFAAAAGAILSSGRGWPAAGSRRAGVESYLMLVVYAIGAALLIAASGAGG